MTRRRMSIITPLFLLSLLAIVLAIAPTLVQAFRKEGTLKTINNF